jgi:hypothetical protein
MPAAGRLSLVRSESQLGRAADYCFRDATGHRYVGDACIPHPQIRFAVPTQRSFRSSREAARSDEFG